MTKSVSVPLRQTRHPAILVTGNVSTRDTREGTSALAVTLERDAAETRSPPPVIRPQPPIRRTPLGPQWLNDMIWQDSE